MIHIAVISSCSAHINLKEINTNILAGCQYCAGLDSHCKYLHGGLSWLSTSKLQPPLGLGALCLHAVSQAYAPWKYHFFIVPHWTSIFKLQVQLIVALHALALTSYIYVHSLMCAGTYRSHGTGVGRWVGWHDLCSALRMSMQYVPRY